MIPPEPLVGIPLFIDEDASRRDFGGRRSYAESVRRAGAVPVFLPPLSSDDAGSVVKRLDGLLLPGGGDVDPALYAQEPHPRTGRISRALDLFETALVGEAKRLDLPLLAICRGVQVLNVARGGSLHQHIPDCVESRVEHGGDRRHELRHAVAPASGSLLASIFGPAPFDVNSMHHQAVDRAGAGLMVSGVCPEDGLVEALEDPEMRFCLGVQFHPEELGEPFHRLFDAFVCACRTGAI